MLARNALQPRKTDFRIGWSQPVLFGETWLISADRIFKRITHNSESCASHMWNNDHNTCMRINASLLEIVPIACLRKNLPFVFLCAAITCFHLHAQGNSPHTDTGSVSFFFYNVTVAKLGRRYSLVRNEFICSGCSYRSQCL